MTTEKTVKTFKKLNQAELEETIGGAGKGPFDWLTFFKNKLKTRT